MNFGPGGHDHDSPNQLFLVYDTPNDSKESRENKPFFEKNVMLGNIKFLEIYVFKNIGKDARRPSLEIRFIILEHLEYGISICQKT